MSIGLETARVITAGARAAGKERGLKPLTVVVLDAGGHVVSVEREDGASNNRFEIAYGKAYGALALGMGSRSLMARAEQQAYFISAAAVIMLVLAAVSLAKALSGPPATAVALWAGQSG